MRALLDANVFLSYLLDRTSNTPPVGAVEAALNGHYTLLITARVIGEVREKSETKPYLAARVKQHQVDQLIEILNAIAETIPNRPEPFPEVGRDRKDDYLFAHAVVGEADYLVSGDTGPQQVGHIDGVQIVSPAGFIQVLQQSDPVE